jgi:hypothetical protein
MEADMRSFCRDNRIESENELIRRAIARHIYADYDDETLKLQALRQVQEKMSKLEDMLSVMFSYMKFMHVNILAYHPEIDEALTDAAFASATARHAKFFAAFQDSLKNDPPFFERLLHKFFSGDDDGQN